MSGLALQFRSECLRNMNFNPAICGSERSPSKACVLQCLPYCLAPRLNFAQIQN
jgi:hypothetical protein